MNEVKEPFSLLRGFVALLIVMFLGFALLLIIPFQVEFGITVTNTHTLFGSVNTIHFVHDLFFLYSLRVPIEVFGYNSILSGFSWYFVITLLVGIVQWFPAGYFTRSHKTNLALWGIGLVLLVLTAWLGVRIPPTNVPAYDAFVALEGLVFSLDVWFPVVMFSVAALGSAGLGTVIGRRRRTKRMECTLTDLAADQCVRI